MVDDVTESHYLTPFIVELGVDVFGDLVCKDSVLRAILQLYFVFSAVKKWVSVSAADWPAVDVYNSTFNSCNITAPIVLIV